MKKKSPVAAAVLAVAFLVAVWAWSRRDLEVAPVRIPTEAGAAESTPMVSGLDPIPAKTSADPTPTREAEVTPATAPAEHKDPPEDVRSLVLKFVDPAIRPVTVEHGSLLLTSASGERRETTIQQQSRVRIERLAAGRYAVAVVAPGFGHLGEHVEVRPDEDEGEEQILLWPEGWIPVACETPAGKPFPDLARSLGMEPKQLFVDAFDVRTRADAPRPGEWDEQVPQPAEFVKPRGYQSWSMGEGVIGALRLDHPPPMWVGLQLYRRTVGWELLSPGQRRVVFRLDESMFEDRFAALTLLVVDLATGEPITDARATLNADSSALRRKEHHEVDSARAGAVAFARIVPGRYELTIARAEAQHQEFVDLAAGDRRDLGKIAIGLGGPLDIRVVNEQGQPVTAFVELGTYRAGAREDDLYPPMISHATDGDGFERMPMPSEISVVRATEFDARVRLYGSGKTDHRSESVRIDPRNPPAGPLVLVVSEPTRVVFEAIDEHVAVVEIRDALDLVRAEVRIAHAVKSPEASLIKGRYRLYCRSEDGASLGEREFEVGSETLRVSVP